MLNIQIQNSTNIVAMQCIRATNNNKIVSAIEGASLKMEWNGLDWTVDYFIEVIEVAMERVRLTLDEFAIGIQIYTTILYHTQYTA